MIDPRRGVHFAILLLAAGGSANASEPTAPATAAHAHSFTDENLNLRLPTRLDVLWQVRPNIGTIESFASTGTDAMLAAGSRGEALALDRNGHVLWSKSFGAAWLLPPFATAFGFTGITSPLTLVGFSASGIQHFETPLPTEAVTSSLLHAALSNGGVALALTRRLFVMDQTGAQTIDLKLPENAKGLLEAGSSLNIALTSGKVLALSAWGTPSGRGSLNGTPDVWAALGSDQLLFGLGNEVVSLHLRSRRVAHVLTLEPLQRALILEVNAGGFHLLTQEGWLTHVDGSGRQRFSLNLLRLNGRPADASPSAFMATDSSGASALATPEGRLLLVTPAGAVVAEKILACGRISALSKGRSRLFVGCSDGKIFALGKAEGRLAPPLGDDYTQRK